MREVRFTLDDDLYMAVRFAAAGLLTSVAGFCRDALELAVKDARRDIRAMSVVAGIVDGTPDVLAAADAAVSVPELVEHLRAPVLPEGENVEPVPFIAPDRRIEYGGRWYRLSETSGVPGCQHRTVKRDLGQSVKCRACKSVFLPEPPDKR